MNVGARFEFRGRRYEKMNAEVGRDEERGGNVFHASTEVESVECPGSSGGAGGPGIAHLRFEISEKAGGGVRVIGKMGRMGGRPGLAPVNCWWPVRGPRRRNRLGREPGRELRPYGTL